MFCIVFFLAYFDVSLSLFSIVFSYVFRSVSSGVICGTNVAEFEDEFDPALDVSFASEFVVRSGAGIAAIPRPRFDNLVRESYYGIPLRR